MSTAKTFVYDGHDGFFEEPHSIAPLPTGLNTGLIVLGICGLVSFLATLSLLSFVAYRFAKWEHYYKTFIGYNQYVLLFLNLVFADLLQAASFLVSFYWVAKDAILAPTPGCSAQGFILHLGDISSAFFVLAIALHTYWTAVMSRRIPYRIFGITIICLWLAAIFLTVIGLAIHQETYFVRAGAWCWISSAYETERLGLHYFWLFLSEFGLIVLYAVTFIQLRRKTRSFFSADDRNAGITVTNQKSIDAVNRITTLMMLYPLVYVVLTLPLSSARMWSMAHGGKTPSTVTNCVTGALLASCGWVDCLLYTLTRDRLLNQTMGQSSSKGDTTGQSQSDNTASNAKNGTILQTTTFTVQNESLDFVVEEGQDSKAGAGGIGNSTTTAQAKVSSDSASELSAAGRSKSESETVVRDRSPSPTGSVDPIIAREKQGMSGVSRVLANSRRRDFASGVNNGRAYELDELAK
ncbi:hypothetical protein Q7P37_005354 [Cladosporium fusiforme]